MPQLAKPSASNEYLASHVSHLLRSYHQLTGRYLVEPDDDPTEVAELVNEAPFS